MELKITLSNQIRILSFHFWGTIMMLIVLCFLNFDVDFSIIFGIYYLILTIPMLYLHIEYYLSNKGQIITISDDTLIKISRSGIKQNYKFSELNRVILYKSASIEKGGIQITPLDSYHYLRIITNSGDDVIITCMMCKDLDKVVAMFQGVPKIRKKGFFCTLLWR